MNREELLKAIGNIDEELILRAREVSSKRRRVWVKYTAAAASILLVLSLYPLAKWRSIDKTAAPEAVSSAYSASTATVQRQSQFMADTDTKKAADLEAEPELLAETGECDAVEGDRYVAATSASAIFLQDGEKRYLLTDDREELLLAGISGEPSEQQKGEYLGDCVFLAQSGELSMLEKGTGFSVYKLSGRKGDAVRLLEMNGSLQYAVFSGFKEEQQFSELFSVYGIESEEDLLSVNFLVNGELSESSKEQFNALLELRYVDNNGNGNSEKIMESAAAPNDGAQQAVCVVLKTADDCTISLEWYAEEELIALGDSYFSLNSEQNSVLTELVGK